VAAAPSPDTVPILGLTGAIAAGKSETLAAFERRGAATLSTDAVVHELLGTERVRDVLVGRWGAEVAPGGEIDRARVGAIVFERPEELRWLESVLHPLVGERVLGWRAALDPGTPLGVIEVPLLFETGMEDLFDATVCVVAPDPVRAERAGARGIEDLAGRSERQLLQDEKAARATYVLRNDEGLDALETRVAELVDDILAARAGR
jgi:dephospho-CoA kinase